MIALRFKTSVARSLARAASQADAASRPAVANAGHSSAERGDFSHSARPTTPPRGMGKVPQWLQKLEERFPLELFVAAPLRRNAPRAGHFGHIQSLTVPPRLRRISSGPWANWSGSWSSAQG